MVPLELRECHEVLFNLFHEFVGAALDCVVDVHVIRPNLRRLRYRQHLPSMSLLFNLGLDKFPESRSFRYVLQARSSLLCSA